MRGGGEGNDGQTNRLETPNNTRNLEKRNKKDRKGREGETREMKGGRREKNENEVLISKKKIKPIPITPLSEQFPARSGGTGKIHR